MPLYEYFCKHCNSTRESIENLDVKSIKCECGNTATKVVSAPNFVIKGFSEANGYSGCKPGKKGGG